MAYSAGSTILDDDYNGFATDVNNVWGAGSGDSGYGQSSTIPSVSAGATIAATNWTTLLARITSAAAHQGTTITSITNPVAGNTIEAYAALSSNITAVVNNRSNATASGSDASATTTTTSSWTASATTTKTITFGSTSALRYFFNAGGMIRMSFSRSGGTSSDQNTSWTSLLSNTGTVVVTGTGTSKTIASVTYTGTTKIGGGGQTPSTLLTGTGAIQYTGTPTAIFKQFGGTYLYTANYVNINASVSGSVITFAVSLVDAFVPPDEPGAPGAGTDLIDGTLTMTTVIRPPSTGTLSDTWGSVTQNSASWSLT